MSSCEDHEIPSNYKSASCSPSNTYSSDVDTEQYPVDRSLTGLATLVKPPPCVASVGWINKDDNDKSMYVDLRLNPERYTGYAGDSARRIWNAVYNENCFTFSAKCSSGICSPDTCKEERVLYRLISGLHSSITMHIAKEYHYEVRNFWGPNAGIYKDRLKQHPERLVNLRVIYAVILRAIAKIEPILNPSHARFDYSIGDEKNDQLTVDLLSRLYEMDILNPTCEQKVFDESDMFLTNQQHLLPEFRVAFRNISNIMDCVGCEKCKLWGKLQFLGLGNAMKILFEKDLPQQFERNDVIALVNLLYKLSTSVLMIDAFDRRIDQQKRMYYKLGMAMGVLVLFYVSSLVHRRTLAKVRKNNRTE